jgi:hypothetical protein
MNNISTYNPEYNNDTIILKSYWFIFREIYMNVMSKKNERNNPWNESNLGTWMLSWQMPGMIWTRSKLEERMTMLQPDA